MKKKIVILFVFLTKVKENIFDEDFFTEACLSDTSIFNAKFNLHHKGKENLSKIEDLIENPANVVERQKIRTEDLKKLIQEKYLIQKKTDVIVEDLFLNK